jgi:hypothetical protein
VRDLVEYYRQELKQKLLEPYTERAITISPDFWSDPYKQTSYLGLNASIVDADYQLISIDLFCRSFTGVKSAEAILTVRQFSL